MKELYRLYGDRVRFVEVVVRQAHPGERHGGYRSYAEKRADALRYEREENIRWPLAIDDFDGTVQRAYGGMSASLYLIDADGRVAFCSMWGHAPALRRAIDALLVQGGNGTLSGQTIDRAPHLAAAFVAGQGGPGRGGVCSFVDLELGFPTALMLMTGGGLLRPVLAPLVLRTAPLPRLVRGALLAGLAVVVTALLWVARYRRQGR